MAEDSIGTVPLPNAPCDDELLRLTVVADEAAAERSALDRTDGTVAFVAAVVSCESRTVVVIIEIPEEPGGDRFHFVNADVGVILDSEIIEVRRSMVKALWGTAAPPVGTSGSNAPPSCRVNKMLAL